jgi:hypothetical protein
MPINACSINKQTINGRCKLSAIIIVPLQKGHIRNIPPSIYRRFYRNIDETDDDLFINLEQPYVTVTLDLLGDRFTETQENIPLDVGSIVYINNIDIHEFQISVNINNLRVKK